MHGKGEWAKFCLKIDDESYDAARKQFCPKADWAAELVRTAKDAGCRYITLTTRHHDGYSLYDTCGLNEYDTVHDCGRDLVREFVDACRAGGIVPFFYHTLLDWHEKTYQTDFQAYLRYLRSSVELLCRNYGEIGGFWFDGKWNKPDADWEEDALYGMIRRYQPDTILINNTGLEGRGQLGNIELDSVTFERGKPQPINLADSPKYIASEMCEVTCDHWGYAREELNIKEVIFTKEVEGFARSTRRRWALSASGRRSSARASTPHARPGSQSAAADATSCFRTEKAIICAASVWT